MAEDTDETPRESARDARSVQEISPSFAWLLQQCGDGSLHHDLTREMQDICAAMNQYVQDFHAGKVKAKLKIEIDFTLEKGVFDIMGTYSVKKPASPAAGCIMFATADNRFTPNNPRQLNMFPTGPRAVL